MKKTEGEIRGPGAFNEEQVNILGDFMRMSIVALSCGFNIAELLHSLTVAKRMIDAGEVTVETVTEREIN